MKQVVVAPLVSIVMPVFNAERFLRDAVLSVTRQDYEHWELIMVDDCSTDRSGEIASALSAEDERILYLCNRANSGAGVSRNRAIEAAKGDYVAFLDADDLWVSNRLRVHVDFMESRSIAFSHSSYGYVDANGYPIGTEFRVSHEPVTYTRLLRRPEISCLTAMYNAKLIGKYYMSAHRRKQDYSLWLKITKDGYSSVPIDKVLAYYRQTPQSATGNKLAMALQHAAFLRETQNLSRLQSWYYTAHYVINGLRKYRFLLHQRQSRARRTNQ